MTEDHFRKGAVGAIVAGFVMAGCSEDYPDCTPGDGAGGAPDVTITVGAGPTGATTGGDWSADPEDHGYSRDHLTGEVCACDALDDAQRGCVDTPPEANSNSVTCDPEATGDGSCEGPSPQGGDAYHGKKPPAPPPPPEPRQWQCQIKVKCIEVASSEKWFWVDARGSGPTKTVALTAAFMKADAKCLMTAKSPSSLDPKTLTNDQIKCEYVPVN